MAKRRIGCVISALTKYPLGMKSETAPRRKETVLEAPIHARMPMLAPTPTAITRMVLVGLISP